MYICELGNSTSYTKITMSVNNRKIILNYLGINYSGRTQRC